MTDTGMGAGRLEVGAVLEGTFKVIGRNFLVFLILAVVLGALPQVLMGLGLVALDLTGENQGLTTSRVLTVAGGVFLNLITGFMLQAAIVHGAIDDLNGRRLRFGDCLVAGIRYFLPLLGLAILLGIAVFFGFLLLIVPGIIMLVVWAVVVPAVVVERRSVFGAFDRSAALTQGNRWRVLLVGIVFWILTIILSLVIGGVIGGFSAVFGGLEAVTRMNDLLGTPLANGISALFSSTATAVLYFELRRLKEGVGVGELARIFG